MDSYSFVKQVKRLNSNYEMPVLMYHRVVNSSSEAGKHNIWITLKRLRRHFNYLKKQGYHTYTFHDLANNPDLHKKEKSIILTFDDGYLDNFTILFPLLKEFSFKAVIFMVTGLDHNKWGVIEGEPRIPLMSKENIKEMDEYGVEFGGHTRQHPVLLKLDAINQKEEIGGSKSDLESILNKPVISFAYPFGGVNEEVKKNTQEVGYTFGISTNTGPIIFHDPFQIRRIEISCRTTLFSFKRKVSGHYLKNKK